MCNLCLSLCSFLCNASKVDFGLFISLLACVHFFHLCGDHFYREWWGRVTVIGVVVIAEKLYFFCTLKFCCCTAPPQFSSLFNAVSSHLRQGTGKSAGTEVEVAKGHRVMYHRLGTDSSEDEVISRISHTAHLWLRLSQIFLRGQDWANILAPSKPRSSL